MSAKVITIAGERNPFIVIKEPVQNRIVVIKGVQGPAGAGGAPATAIDYLAHYNLAKG